MPRVDSDGRSPDAGAAATIDAVTAWYASGIPAATAKTADVSCSALAQTVCPYIADAEAATHPLSATFYICVRPPCYTSGLSGHSGCSPGH